MKRIVVLGANSQLGTYIVNALASDIGIEVVPVTGQELEVEQTERIIPFLQSLGEFHVLINCTAFHNSMTYKNEPLKALLVSGIAVWRMTTYCRHHDIVLIHFSSDYEPFHMNGSSKAADEAVIAGYLDKYFILRPFVIDGQFMSAAHTRDIANAVKTCIDKDVPDYGIYQCSADGIHLAEGDQPFGAEIRTGG